MKILVTGGTVFVSKYVATYFVNQGNEVYVLNRNTRSQVEGVTLIEGDRHALGDKLRNINFDVVLDITAYDEKDIVDLCGALGEYGQYIFISSSAVYPEYERQPFVEEGKLDKNKFWGQYGIDKIEAEKVLLNICPNAYIIRPPYLYGPMNDVYREAFVFDCARANRKFYLPGDGEMKLQFFHVNDLCKILDVIIKTNPEDHIINVGNEEAISIKHWVTLCYKCLDKTPTFVEVDKSLEQRKYFSFYNYEYYLDIKKQQKLLSETIKIEDGLKEALSWYLENEEDVEKRPYIKYIEEELS